MLDLAERRPGRPRPTPRRRRRSAPATYRLHVRLERSEPPIWRRLDVAHDLTLPHLFEATRTAMGWSGFLLHFFRVPADSGGAVTYSPAYGTWARAGHDEAGVCLDEVVHAPGDRLRLAVVDDYGDEWWHEIVLEEIGAPDPERRARCVDGERACPAGDSEGIDHYNAAVAQWRDDVDASRRSVWWSATHDPEEFDAGLVDDVLDHVLPRAHPALPTVPARPDVVESVHALWWRCTDDGRAALDRLVDDLGDLGDVGAEQPEGLAGLVADWTELIRAIGDGVPFAPGRPPEVGDVDLVAQAVRLGLLRVLRGRLVTTVAARRGLDRPAALWRHIARRMLGARADLPSDADIVAALQIATGREHSMLLTTRILTSAGHTELDEPLTPAAASRALGALRTTLEHTGGQVYVGGVPTITPAGRALCRLAAQRPGSRAGR